MNDNPVDVKSNHQPPCSKAVPAETLREGLKEQAHLLQTLLDAIPTPVFYKNRVGIYTACNTAFAETVLGLPRDKILGRSLFELTDVIPHDLADIYQAADDTLLKNGGPQSYEAQVRCADGRRHDFLFHKTTYTGTNDHIEGICGVMLDLTRQKQAIDALLKKEQSLSQIVMGNSIPTFVIDKNHIITHWNRACENLTDKTASDVVGTHWHWSAFYPDQRPVLADMIVDGASNHAMETFYKGKFRPSTLIRGAYEAEDYFPNLGESGRWLFFTAAPLTDEQGDITGAIETLQDITEYRLTLDRLHESEKRYRLVADRVADGVCIIQKNRFAYVNAAFVNIFGHSCEDDLVGKRVADVIENSHRRHYRQMETGFMAGRFLEKEIQLMCVRPDESTFWVEGHNSIIKWGEAPALLATVRDITERKHQEMAIRQEAHDLKTENIRLKSKIKDQQGLGDLIGTSPAMQAVYDHILKAASSPSNVVIYGESGTGKELVARTIHDLSDRGGQDMITVNCGAIPESLFESEFFGHKKGAFTGAVMDKSGYLESADGSTLFLDEVGEMPLNIQVKLLRAIENKGFVPLGSTRFVPIEVRLIAATHRDLKALIKTGRMREDFFYRIHVLPIHVPPLRERKTDLPLLIYHFLNILNTASDETDDTVIPEHIIRAMTRHHWPGNVRELQNAIHRYHTFKTMECMDPSLAEASPEYAHVDFLDDCDGFSSRQRQSLSQAMAQYEKELIVNALDRNRGNRTRAAAALGIERRTLQRKLKKLGIHNTAPA